MLSNFVEVFMYVGAELRGVKRVTVRGDITVFKFGTFKFHNFYFNYHMEVNQVNFFRFLTSKSAPHVCTTPYPVMWT